MYFFKERLTLARALAVIACVGGVFMVAFGAASDSEAYGMRARATSVLTAVPTAC